MRRGEDATSFASSPSRLFASNSEQIYDSLY
jgi:hypothetical protein